MYAGRVVKILATGICFALAGIAEGKDGEKDTIVVGDTIGTQGTLTILSDPPGARVILDSMEVGVTPVTVGTIGTSTHRIVLSLDGYLTKVATVRTTGGDDEVSFSLTRPCTLTVLANINGATVFLDTMQVGIAPVTRDALRPGQYKVRVRAPGTADFDASVSLTPGVHDTVRAVLGVSGTPYNLREPKATVSSRAHSSMGRRRLSVVAAVVFAVFCTIVIIVDVSAD